MSSSKSDTDAMEIDSNSDDDDISFVAARAAPAPRPTRAATSWAAPPQTAPSHRALALAQGAATSVEKAGWTGESAPEGNGAARTKNLLATGIKKATPTGKRAASVTAPDKVLKVVAKPSHATFKKTRTAAPPPPAAIASRTQAAATVAAAVPTVQKRDGDLNLVQSTPLSDFLVAVQVHVVQTRDMEANWVWEGPPTGIPELDQLARFLFRHLLDPTALVAFLQPRYPNVPLCVENLQMLFRLPRDMAWPIDLHLLPTHLDMLRRIQSNYGSHAQYRVFVYARPDQMSKYRSEHGDLATLVPWMRGSYTVITVPTRLDDPFRRVPNDRTFASAIVQDAAILFPDQVPEPPGELAVHLYSDSKAWTETIDYSMAWQLMVEEEHPPAAAIVMGTFAVGLRNLTATLHHRGNMCALRAADVDELLMLHTWVSMWCAW
ncbi:hypothetical protein AMAG_19290 [Allomyces macrogynus ATCC 38327]|uniref:Uncharacterized protein n=1 Tax=Allomyces macrogynus (strain ATCC 38327) TaxID=578462 RepID=A0A0L0SQQ9_ALLM3|nr:hypothetical protein AMAG_19290 [Allomyces macrogynus ATCC 38327]|eukprot:KNE64841.1 hypothetical protein AMAG_19290 [Allomyces macrogynus ATCC 38327]